MTMAKRHKLATRGLGAEPGIPEVKVLADWIAEHRGRTADITTYRCDQSMAPQIEAGIGHIGAGGKFVADHILESLLGVEDRTATGELQVQAGPLREDAAGIFLRKKGSWCALPAPHVLGITDSYYHDDEEWADALTGVYRAIMREMRDLGIPGHILICETTDEPEIAALAQHQRCFFFKPDPSRTDLERILDRQNHVAIGKEGLKILLDCMDEYEVSRIILMDPDDAAIRQAMSHFDPDQVTIGGYCKSGDAGLYWNNLVEGAGYWK
jgi:hypothetical protein